MLDLHEDILEIFAERSLQSHIYDPSWRTGSTIFRRKGRPERKKKRKGIKRMRPWQMMIKTYYVMGYSVRTIAEIVRVDEQTVRRHAPQQYT